MAGEFAIGEQVVTKQSPALLGVGRVIPTPKYSSPRLIWAKFSGDTEAAFEPGELELIQTYIARIQAEDRWRLANRWKGAQ
jgi:hypothetical protein